MKTYKDILEYIRNYKAEYKKFQSSPERIKYRAELVKYNRDKGTYGNGDKKDASHKGGKIVGFEDQSKNRGRAEASRLKKEDVPKKPSVPKKGKTPEMTPPAVHGDDSWGTKTAKLHKKLKLTKKDHKGVLA